MEARIERRAPDVPRIPLDVLVRLTHEDFEEPFDADGVDVSTGGLALRADYLPEVGDRLRCRFDCPPEGGEIEIDGEVVWAHDAGERSGEFGLRFTALDPYAEHALGQLLAAVGEPDPLRPTARLHLEHVATPIDAEIVSREPGALTVEQELPFLRLGMGVVVEGTGPAHGKLSAVGLRVEGGVPRLVLSVREEAPVEEPAHGAYGADSDAAYADAPPEDEAQALAATADAGDRGEWQPDASNEPDATLQDYELPASLLERAGRMSEDTSDAALDERPAGHRFELAEEQLEERLEESARLADSKPAHVEQRVGLAERVGPGLARAREALVAAYDKARPMLAAAWAKLALWGAMAAEKGGPRLKQLVARLGTFGGALGGRISARLASGKKAKRRTTAAPVRKTAQPPRLRRQRGEEPAPPPARKNRRAVVLAALAFVVVAALVYGLGREDAPTPVEEPSAASSPAPAPESIPAFEPPPAPVVAPVATSAARAPEPPEAVAAPEEPQAGRLDEPSYPSLREAVSRPASSSQTYGAAEVPNGRSTTLRMSQPVTALRGEQQPDGFTVTIPGALSLDRAGPIAAANPAIEQAMVLNRGDHAVLTVRFVAGRTPPYRVVARGAAVEVTIGR